MVMTSYVNILATVDTTSPQSKLLVCMALTAMMPWEFAATVLNMGHALLQTACIYAKRSSVGFHDSLQATGVVSSVVPCPGLTLRHYK